MYIFQSYIYRIHGKGTVLFATPSDARLSERCKIFFQETKQSRDQSQVRESARDRYAMARLVENPWKKVRGIERSHPAAGFEVGVRARGAEDFGIPAARPKSENFTYAVDLRLSERSA